MTYALCMHYLILLRIHVLHKTFSFFAVSPLHHVRKPITSIFLCTKSLKKEIYTLWKRVHTFQRKEWLTTCKLAGIYICQPAAIIILAIKCNSLHGYVSSLQLQTIIRNMLSCFRLRKCGSQRTNWQETDILLKSFGKRSIFRRCCTVTIFAS